MRNQSEGPVDWENLSCDFAHRGRGQTVVEERDGHGGLDRLTTFFEFPTKGFLK